MTGRSVMGAPAVSAAGASPGCPGCRAWEQRVDALLDTVVAAQRDLARNQAYNKRLQDRILVLAETCDAVQDQNEHLHAANKALAEAQRHELQDFLQAVTATRPDRTVGDVWRSLVVRVCGRWWSM